MHLDDSVFLIYFFFPLLYSFFPQGLVHVHQIPRLNSLICDVSDTKDLAFRLKRKLFTIEVREMLFHYLEPKRWS